MVGSLLKDMRITVVHAISIMCNGPKSHFSTQPAFVRTFVWMWLEMWKFSLASSCKRIISRESYGSAYNGSEKRGEKKKKLKKNVKEILAYDYIRRDHSLTNHSILNQWHRESYSNKSIYK